jgi:hypothetical protein
VTEAAQVVLVHAFAVIQLKKIQALPTNVDRHTLPVANVHHASIQLKSNENAVLTGPNTQCVTLASMLVFRASGIAKVASGHMTAKHYSM